ncbi:unnamed protein product [Ambrosiozyma monospora]|uniref:Unnamed protein product n=1 Tax=Ambrosiozyma monospora TaxID=43982 RepID=A0ACB5T3P8_AMBMO|nr:unnamed protein product [Ambrosiozyma monospora]
MITLDTNYGIFTKLPSNSSIFIIDNDSPTTNLMSATAHETSSKDGNSGNKDANDGLFLHEALAKLEDNCILLDMKSYASSVVAMTVFGKAIKWCHTFLMTADLNFLEIVEKIDHDLKEMVTKFEKLLGSLIYLELEMEPMIAVVVSSSIASIYHCLLEKFSSFFEQQIEQHSQRDAIINTITPFDIPVSITEEHIQFFKWIFSETYKSCPHVIDGLLKNNHGFFHKHTKPDQSIIWNIPTSILFNKSIKSLFHVTACFRRFKNLLRFDPQESKAIETKLNEQMKKVCDLVFHKDDEPMNSHNSDSFEMKNLFNALPNDANDWKKRKVVRLQLSLKTWLDKLDHKPEEISYFNIL